MHERYHDNIGSRGVLFFFLSSFSSSDHSCEVARMGCRLDKACVPTGEVRKLAVVWLMRFMSYARYLCVVGLMNSDLFHELTCGFFSETNLFFYYNICSKCFGRIVRCFGWVYMVSLRDRSTCIHIHVSEA